VGLSSLALVGKLGVVERLSFDNQLWIAVYVFLFRGSDHGVPTDTAHHHHVLLGCPLDQLGDMFWSDQRSLIETHRAAPANRGPRTHSAARNLSVQRAE
jgi:hypothetical protein